MRAFGRVATRIAPPDLAIFGNLEGEDLHGLTLVDAVKEIVQVHRVRDFPHDAVEHQEPINTTPEENAVVVDNAVR